MRQDVRTTLAVEILATVQLPYKRVTHDRNAQITIFVPQVLCGVQTNQCGGKETNPLDTAYTTNGQARECKPDEPLSRERFLTEVMESSEAEHGRESEEEQHGVQENESRDGGIRVIWGMSALVRARLRAQLTTEDHQSNQPGSALGPSHLLASVVGQWNAEGTECSIKDSHEGVVDFWWVFGTRFEGKRAIVTSEITRETDQHLSEWRMDIEVEFTFKVVRTELSETVANCQ